MPGTAYAIDTRPDSALKSFQRQMRGSNQLKGRGGSSLHCQGATATLTFWGETDQGVRLEGVIDCRKVDRQ